MVTAKNNHLEVVKALKAIAKSVTVNLSPEELNDKKTQTQAISSSH